MLPPLNCFTRCSPSPHQTASATLLFPLPFGPTMPVIPLWNSNLILLANDLNPCTSMLFKYIPHLLYILFMQFQNADICSLLLCCFLRPAFSDSVFFFSDMYRNTENLIMIRSLFTNQMIRDYFFKIRMHDFLQDSLAIKKEFLIVKVIKNELINKFFCISKTTIKIDGSYNSLTGI